MLPQHNIDLIGFYVTSSYNKIKLRIKVCYLLTLDTIHALGEGKDKSENRLKFDLI